MIAKIIDTNIRKIETDTVIIYKKNLEYKVYYKDVFVLQALLGFSFYRTKNIFEMYIDKNYLNYVLKKLNEASISYILVDSRNQYHILKKNSYNENHYKKYYQKGRRLYKRKKQVNKIIKYLQKQSVSLKKIKEIECLLEGEYHYEIIRYL